MGKLFEQITPELKVWIEKQKIFFVGTAPLSADGHINVSPKGLDSFRIIDQHTVVYQDFTGSGVETISHVRENKRIVIMFCSFEGPPKILRLHGDGEIIFPSDARYNFFASLFPERLGIRAYIHIDVKRIQESCGYGVPLYDFKSDRDVMEKWAAAKGADGIVEYQKQKNSVSIDGIPGIINA